MEKYTVIIPTRDRAETLESALKTCLSQAYPNYEVIVSDNFSSDSTREVVAKFSDARLKYINPGRRLSMTENFEFALSHVGEGFVMFIGDDDGLLPDSINYVAEVQKRFNVLAISGQSAEYCWPNFPDISRANFLSWASSKDKLELRTSRRWVQRCLSFREPYTFGMPKLYHGFVHKSVIDKAFSAGAYFASITPDAYSAFATAFFVDKYVFSYKPFTIGGASGKSNGVSGLEKKGSNNEANKYLKENTLEFHSDYKFTFSLEVVMAETFAQFSDRFPNLTHGFAVDKESMLRFSVSTANSKNYEDVKAAATVMAEKYSLDLRRRSCRFLFKKAVRFFDSLLRRAKTVMFGARIADSSLLGVNNVYDASLYIHKRFK